MNNRPRNGTGSTQSMRMTSEDSDVWQHFTQTIKPFQRFPYQTPDIRSPEHCELRPAEPSSQKDSPPPTTQSQDLDDSKLPPLIMGVTPGLDRRAAIRLRRGQWRIEATLDLHGYRRDTAQVAIEGFIRRSATEGRRCVRVVTGKGIAGDIETGWRGQGVLRAGLSDWLNAPRVRPLILAYDQAQPRDGGGGAFYILLRRRRQG